MNILKKKIKLIILFIILIVIASGVSVYATAQYLATQVEYKDGKSVASALDELYVNKKETSDTTYSITANDTYNLDKYYKNINVNVATKNGNYQVTKIDPSSRGVFNIPSDVTTAYIMFLNATSGNQEYTFNVTGNIITSGPTLISKTSAIDVNLWSGLYLYKVELSGNSGTITCAASGADGNQRGYQFAMFY